MDSISLIACAETAILQQVAGVGPLIALTFILTVDDKSRFQKSRDIGCYVGLRSDSGQSQPQLRITMEGDPYLRTIWCKERTTSSAAGDRILIRSDGAIAPLKLPSRQIECLPFSATVNSSYQAAKKLL